VPDPDLGSPKTMRDKSLEGGASPNVMLPPNVTLPLNVILGPDPRIDPSRRVAQFMPTYARRAIQPHARQKSTAGGALSATPVLVLPVLVLPVLVLPVMVLPVMVWLDQTIALPTLALTDVASPMVRHEPNHDGFPEGLIRSATALPHLSG